MSEQDEPVYNEPVATGTVQTIVSGDIAHAKTYLREARRTLGQLRINQGVNERMARGEAGGFYKATKTMEDGTRIETITNDGRDVIRIHAPTTSPEGVKTEWRHHEEQRPDIRGSHHSYIPPIHHEQVETTISRTSESEEEDGEEKEEFSPYMWVGVRVKQEGVSAGSRDTTVPLNAPLLYMVEPAQPKVEGFQRGIVANTYQNGWYNYVGADLDEARLDEQPPYLPPLEYPVSQMVSAFHDYWGELSSVAATCHNLMFIDYAASADGDAFMFSANGLRMYCWDLRRRYNSEQTPTENCIAFHPYDPSLPEDDQAGLTVKPPARVYSAAFDQYYYDSRIEQDKRAWDYVYVLDPKEGEGIEPYDPRLRNSLARMVLENAGMAAGDAVVLPGIYTLHVGAYGSNELQSARAGQRRTGGWGGLDENYFWPTDATDFGEYLRTPYQSPTYEIEVRLGKAPETIFFNYEVTIGNYAEFDKNVFPGGTTPTTFGCPDGGPNGHNANWGPTLQIDVLSGTCAMEYFDDAGVFAPGGGIGPPEPDNRRYGMDLYISSSAGITGSDRAGESLAQYTSRKIYDWMLQACTGYWGYRKDASDPGDEYFLEGKLAGFNWGTPDQTFQIFRFRPETHELIGLPRLPDADPPPGWEPDRTGQGQPPTPDGWMWFEALLWWYPYNYISKANCRTPYWMVCVGPLFGTGELGVYGDPTPNCC